MKVLKKDQHLMSFVVVFLLGKTVKFPNPLFSLSRSDFVNI